MSRRIRRSSPFKAKGDHRQAPCERDVPSRRFTDWMRLDQWLWAVRVFKTRSISAEAIKSGRVQVNGVAMKPAHEVRAGELIAIRMEQGALAWTRTLRAIGAPPSRVGAKLVAQFTEDLTSAEE